ncbi:hypothetical protein BAE44_0004358 [Dichanthelium oligosanthes]|uniref:protein-serine/threonine phosphatase n=1 Tax=Dichanthelium oligosanthes TaxID=888268 RepID=A0A1E5WB61_9POAL|nr:hypothetical protein BAE44_0004358 [Dichanthelium oligosanthes]
MLGANAEMHAAPGVDDSMSGTTAVAALVAGGALHVANVGDSRAVAGPGPAWCDKVDYGSIGASIAVHTIQSEIPVFVPPEASHVNRCAATEIQSSSSGSPTERSLSCVVPSPTHPLLIRGRISDACKPVQNEQAAAQPVQPWHQVDGGTELERPMQRSITPASC